MNDGAQTRHAPRQDGRSCGAAHNQPHAAAHLTPETTRTKRADNPRGTLRETLRKHKKRAAPSQIDLCSSSRQPDTAAHPAPATMRAKVGDNVHHVLRETLHKNKNAPHKARETC